MDALPAAVHNQSVSIEFTNDGGTYQAALRVRPKARPDGSLVVNSELELSERLGDERGSEVWSVLSVPGSVEEFSSDDDRISGNIGTEIRSTRVVVSWQGERDSRSGLILTDVIARLSARHDD